VTGAGKMGATFEGSQALSAHGRSERADGDVVCVERAVGGGQPQCSALLEESAAQLGEAAYAKAHAINSAELID